MRAVLPSISPDRGPWCLSHGLRVLLLIKIISQSIPHRRTELQVRRLIAAVGQIVKQHGPAPTNYQPLRSTLTHINVWRTREGLLPVVLQKEKTS